MTSTNPKTKKPKNTTHPGKAFRGTSKKNVDPLPPADRIKRLYASLVAQVDGGHWKGAEKTCDKILRIDPTDADARQTKLFIYLQKEEYRKALELIDEGSPSKAESKPKLFEKAYALYRLKREADAEAILAEIKRHEELEADDEEERGVMHLEAQLNYRQGKYQAAYDLYQQLLDTTDPSSEEHHDVQTNLQAAQTYLDFLNSGYLQAIDHTLTSSSSTATGFKDIENFPPPTIPSSAVTFSAIPSTSASAKGPVAHEEKMKVRVKRLPKGVVPGVTPPPDPERWIKKSQRSNRPMHGKKAKSRASGATQGFTTEAPVPSGTNGGTGSGSTSGGKGRKKK